MLVLNDELEDKLLIAVFVAVIIIAYWSSILRVKLVGSLRSCKSNKLLEKGAFEISFIEYLFYQIPDEILAVFRIRVTFDDL